MNNEILKTLSKIEQDKQVKILFAIESGSRAWGFESTDSDFDVRFVYRSELPYYLTINPGRDVIENDDVNHPDTLLDFSGWDVRKFLGLVNKSNPVCFEWMRSEIGYMKTEEWTEIQKAAWPFFSPKAAMHHYLSMARHNYREHMRDGMAPSVRLKKYLYITRPLLCCRWIERNPAGGPPPMPFIEVCDASVHEELAFELLSLVERKKAGEELDEGAAVPCINRFIDTELWRLRSVADNMPSAHGKFQDLNKLFARLNGAAGRA